MSIEFDKNVAEILKRNCNNNKIDNKIYSMIKFCVKQFWYHYNKDDQCKASIADIDKSFTLDLQIIINSNKPVKLKILLGLKQL